MRAGEPLAAPVAAVAPSPPRRPFGLHGDALGEVRHSIRRHFTGPRAHAFSAGGDTEAIARAGWGEMRLPRRGRRGDAIACAGWGVSTGGAAAAERLGLGHSGPAMALAAETDPDLSIRMPGASGTVECAACRAGVALSGPTAFRGAVVMCDGCLLRAEPELGMLLAVAAVVRSYGQSRPEGLLDETTLRAELLAFARVYERWAGERGPGRTSLDPSRWAPGEAADRPRRPPEPGSE
ncbi:MAG: hypothetical protein MI919_29660 [Holophagales bacterium]|nr:hypothetical protein [Holophagales bacterium]